MEPDHTKDSHPKDLIVRQGKTAPVTKTMTELAENPKGLINDLFADHRRPWYAIPCGDGAWLANWVTAINSYNAGGTDAPGVLGTVSTLVGYIKTGEPLLIEWHKDQIEFAHKHHGIRGIQIITHPLCGGTKEEVCEKVAGAKEVYAHPTKVTPQLFYETALVELENHRRDLDEYTKWAFATFPFIDAVEY